MWASLDLETRGAVILAVVLGFYVLSGYVFYEARCLRCEGTGKKFAPGGEHWHPCRKCTGTGKKMRLIARLLGRRR